MCQCHLKHIDPITRGRFSSSACCHSRAFQGLLLALFLSQSAFLGGKIGQKYVSEITRGSRGRNLNALLWTRCLSGCWFASTSICLEKTGLCHYINTTECTTTPEDISIKLDREDVTAWVSQAVLLCHPSLQGISQQFYKKNISIPSTLTIILICLNWHSPVDSLFKSYTHCYVFIP